MILKKVCMVGPVCVGKTSLVARYVHSIFSASYLSTVGVKIDKKIVQVQNQDVTLLLWDLAGDDDFQRLNLSYLRGAAAYLLVVDGTRKSTLTQAVEIHERIAINVGEVPFILVLNKCDLQNSWEIKEADIADLKSKGWAIRKTSAKEGLGVEDVFTELAGSTLMRAKLNPGNEPSK